MRCSDCTNEIAPIVALDIDGTLAEYHHSFHKFALMYTGRLAEAFRLNNTDESAYPYDVEFSEWLGMDKRTYREVKLAYRQGGQKRMLPAMPYAGPLVQSLRRMGVEVWMTTTRPYLRLDGIDPDTRFWLKLHGCTGYSGLLYDEDKYVMLADRVDKERIVAVVDDLPENIQQAHMLGLPTVMKINGHSSRAVDAGTPGRGIASRSLLSVEEVLRTMVEAWRFHNG